MSENSPLDFLVEFVVMKNFSKANEQTYLRILKLASLAVEEMNNTIVAQPLSVVE